MKRNIANKVMGIAFMAAMLTGCVSSRIRSAIERGDDVSVIEQLAPELSKKPDDKELVPAFDSVYPKAVESRLPVKNIAEIKKEYIGSYGSSDVTAIRECIKELSGDSDISSHRAIASVISQGETTVRNLSDLSRIQTAVRVMPAAIGGNKTGYVTLVEKYTEKFPEEYAQAKKDMGELYYNIASAAFPGESINRKKEIIRYYKKAAEYDSAYSDNKLKIQQLSYEIAVIMKSSASTKKQLEEVISYFNQAGSYKDSADQIRAIKYQLAEIYRGEKTTASYEKAGQLYAEAGNYGNAANESKLYSFYKAIKNLKKNFTDGDVKLSTGVYSPFTLQRSLAPVNDSVSVYTITGKSSALNVYNRGTENTIFPGAVIQGSSIPSQNLKVVTAGARNPVEIKIAMNGTKYGNGTITNTASASTSNSQVRAAAKKYQNIIEPEFTYEFEALESMYDIAVAGELGADRTQVAFANENSLWMNNKSYTLVKVTQKYYTADVVPPDLPVDFFSAKGNVIDQNAIGAVSPYYVASVNYGRKAYFLISSYLSSDEIISDFKKYRPADSKNTGVNGTYVSSSVSTKWRNYGTVINAITVSEKPYTITDIAGIYSWIKTGVDGNVAIEALPPISFSLKDIVSGKYAVLTQTLSARVIENNVPEHTSNAVTGNTSNVTVSGNIYGSGNSSGSSVSGNVHGGSGSSGSVSGNAGSGSSGSGSSSGSQIADEVLFPFMSGNHSSSGSGSTSGNTNSGGNTTTGGSTSVSGNTNNGGNNTTGSTTGSGGSTGVAGNTTTGGNTGTGSSTNSGSTTGSGGSTSVAGNTPTGGNTSTGSNPAAGGNTGVGNSYTSLVFVGKNGYYQCAQITAGDEWIYYINESDILTCCASWDTSEYQTVYVNGINMTKDVTVYSFRDVIGNNISLDIVDRNGNRKHHLLRIYKK